MKFTDSGYILGFPLYHKDYSRWYDGVEQECTAGYMNGFTDVKEDGMTENRYSTKSVTDKTGIGKKTKSALYKTIDLCERNNIDLVLVVTPYQAPDYHMEKLKTVSDIAKENKVAFIDMNNYIDEIGIDLTEDMYDWGHAKKVGEEKNSLWIGQWLIENFELEDRRGNDRYNYWNKVSDKRKDWEKSLN